MNRSNPRARRGFTLMELMISITLVAAIAVGMLMAMRGGLLSLNRIQTRLDENRHGLGIQRVLTLQLGGAIPARTGCAGTASPFAFRGTSSVLQMVSTYSMTEGSRGTPRIVDYQVAPDEGGTVKLLVYERPYAGPSSMTAFCGESIAPQGSPFVAASRLAYCRFSYFPTIPETQFRGGAWLDTWHAPNLPSAVHIDMAPAAPDSARLPVVAITAPLYVVRFFDDLRYEDKAP